MEKIEKSQGEIYRLKARLENAQSEKDSVQEELERAQGTIARMHTERERWVTEVEKLREELERSQATVGKTQIAQEKTQAALDKAQSELDQLQERAERQGSELRRVSTLYPFTCSFDQVRFPQSVIQGWFPHSHL